MVFADAFGVSDATESESVIQVAENLKLSTVKSEKREAYQRSDAVLSKDISFEGKNIKVKYDYSYKDGLDTELDVYAIDNVNQFTLDKNGDVVAFAKYYSSEELEKMENIKYLSSIITVKTKDEAVDIAKKYLTDTVGVDVSKLDVYSAQLVSGTNLYYIVFVKKLGDFVTEDSYIVDVSVTGEIFRYKHKAEPMPSATKVDGYTYDAVEQRAIKEISEAFGDTYRGCTVSEICVVSFDDGDYFKVSADVDYAQTGSSDVYTMGYYQYYEIK